MVDVEQSAVHGGGWMFSFPGRCFDNPPAARLIYFCSFNARVDGTKITLFFIYFGESTNIDMIRLDSAHAFKSSHTIFHIIIILPVLPEHALNHTSPPAGYLRPETPSPDTTRGTWKPRAPRAIQAVLA